MGSYGKCNFDELKRLKKNIEQLENKQNEFMEACAKELAARLLAKVIKRTPVGDYSRKITVVAKRDSKNYKKGEKYTKKVNTSGKVGGTLRRGWTAGKNQSAKNYANSLKINHFGDTYVIEITNPVEYASYVEYGHRTRNGKGWVEGRFMMTISEQEIKSIAPRILENKIKKLLGDCLK